MMTNNNNSSFKDRDFTEFELENQAKIEFIHDYPEDITSFPFTPDAPECLKEKLNDIINLRLSQFCYGKHYTPEPENLILTASVQVGYNQRIGTVTYYIFVNLADYEEEAIIEDERFRIDKFDKPLYKEMMKYCHKKMTDILFPDLNLCTDETQEVDEPRIPCRVSHEFLNPDRIYYCKKSPVDDELVWIYATPVSERYILGCHISKVTDLENERVQRCIFRQGNECGKSASCKVCSQNTGGKSNGTR